MKKVIISFSLLGLLMVSPADAMEHETEQLRILTHTLQHGLGSQITDDLLDDIQGYVRVKDKDIWSLLPLDLYKSGRRTLIDFYNHELNQDHYKASPVQTTYFNTILQAIERDLPERLE